MKAIPLHSRVERVLCICIILFFCLPNKIGHAAPESEDFLVHDGQMKSIPNQEKPVNLPKGTPADWLSTMQKNIKASEYHVTWQTQTLLPDVQAAWHAPNRSQNMRTYFTADTVWVTPRISKTQKWRWGLSLIGCGAVGDVRTVAQPTLSPVENRMEYQRGDGLKEWYINDRKGLEQGFTLNRPPVGKQKGIDDSWIAFRMALRGNLQGTIDSEKNTIDFVSPGGVVVLQYGHLHAFDASKRELPVSMGLNEKTIEIRVNAGRAVYPITIDPMATSEDQMEPEPNWDEDSNQGWAKFGYSVSTAGDVNGDGYSDVIIGACYYDSGEVSEGRVFVYHGSGDGLGDEADWTADGNQTGALFGVDVSTAGDVNGDGYSDIIVGASGYDNGQTDEGQAFVYHGSASGLGAAPVWLFFLFVVLECRTIARLQE